MRPHVACAVKIHNKDTCCSNRNAGTNDCKQLSTFLAITTSCYKNQVHGAKAVIISQVQCPSLQSMCKAHCAYLFWQVCSDVVTPNPALHDAVLLIDQGCSLLSKCYRLAVTVSLQLFCICAQYSSSLCNEILSSTSKGHHKLCQGACLHMGSVECGRFVCSSVSDVARHISALCIAGDG